LLLLISQIIRDSLNHVLAIVKDAFDCNIKNIRVLQTKHLRCLKCAHFFVRRQHENADTFFATHRVFSGAAGIARSRTENI